mgnify:FL=1|tara:strand:- start:236 stop:454 length:219 start_codon:yes stop_codon:yes gene_type:complete
MIQIKDIELTLENLQQQIDHNQNNLDSLLEQRQEIVLHAYNNGLSMIKIAEILKITRQRVFAIYQATQTEEE